MVNKLTSLSWLLVALKCDSYWKCFEGHTVLFNRNRKLRPFFWQRRRQLSICYRLNFRTNVLIFCFMFAASEKTWNFCNTELAVLKAGWFMPYHKNGKWHSSLNSMICSVSAMPNLVSQMKTKVIVMRMFYNLCYKLKWFCCKPSTHNSLWGIDVVVMMVPEDRFVQRSQ